jgi:L-alanine-DL-glutamate epimerase-like enolase superfamily enzyme
VYVCDIAGWIGTMETHALTTDTSPTPSTETDRIEAVTAFPLVQKLPQPTQTSWGRYDAISIVMVQVRTAHGHVGAGEVLARFAPKAYCELIDTCLTPRLIGQDPEMISDLWASMRRSLSGRACGMLVECISGVDIALWDIRGKAVSQPLHALLGAQTAHKIPVYASSINWGDDSTAIAQVERFREAGFDRIKVKIGRSPCDAARRVALIRRVAGDDMILYSDANWAYALHEAEYVGHALQDAGYAWFEEPLDPDDEAGYEALTKRLTIPLAAGESNFTSGQAHRLVAGGTIAFLQPNITRSGGITETWRAVQHAEGHGVTYVAHVGMSGIVCETAGLHVAAAAGGASHVECAMPPNRFKSDIAFCDPGYVRAKGGTLGVPKGPGLGLEIDWDAVQAMCAA